MIQTHWRWLDRWKIILMKEWMDEWMNGIKTQYSKFYGKLIDLTAMKLTCSLWCFYTVHFFLHTQAGWERKREKSEDKRGMKWKRKKCAYSNVSILYILSRTMAEKNIHEFSREKTEHTTRKSISLVMDAMEMNRRNKTRYRIFSLASLTLFPSVIMYAHFVAVDMERNQINYLCKCV